MLNTINVMDNFSRLKRAVQGLLHNQTMFLNKTPFPPILRLVFWRRSPYITIPTHVLVATKTRHRLDMLQMAGSTFFNSLAARIKNSITTTTDIAMPFSATFPFLLPFPVHPTDRTQLCMPSNGGGNHKWGFAPLADDLHFTIVPHTLSITQRTHDVNTCS